MKSIFAYTGIFIILFTSCSFQQGGGGKFQTVNSLESELDLYQYKTSQMKNLTATYSGALEEISVVLMGARFSAYSDAKKVIDELNGEIASYQQLVNKQKLLINKVKNRPSLPEATGKVFSGNHKSMNSIKKSFDFKNEKFLTLFSDLGFKLVLRETRIAEMEEDMLMISADLSKLSDKIYDKQEELASLLNIPGKERNISALGKELNGIERIQRKIKKEQIRLEKIIQITKRNLRRDNYYWIGHGFEKKKFDIAFKESHSKARLLLEDLIELLAED